MEEQTILLLKTYSEYINKIDLSDLNIIGILDLHIYKLLKELDCSNNEITELKIPETIE